MEKVEEEEEDKNRLRLKRKTLEAVLLHCQRALELLSDSDDAFGGGAEPKAAPAEKEEVDRGGCSSSSPSSLGDREADELCDLIKSRVECPDFLENLESAQVPISPNIAEEGSSWDLVSEKDLWKAEDAESDQEEYVLVRQEDIVEGIAGFMAAYLLSLKQTKDLTPSQLQEALSKTFSVKKKKGKLQKAWNGSKVIYNVASWCATAIGIYQNPVILRVASKAFWTSCHVISKLL